MFWYLSQLFMQLFIFDKEEGKNDHWRNSDHEKKTTFILDLVNLCQIKLYSVIPLMIKEILINNSSKWWSFNTFICVCINERYTCLQDTALNHLFYSVWILTASGLLLDYSIPIMLMLTWNRDNVVNSKNVIWLEIIKGWLLSEIVCHYSQ